MASPLKFCLRKDIAVTLPRASQTCHTFPYFHVIAFANVYAQNALSPGNLLSDLLLILKIPTQPSPQRSLAGQRPLPVGSHVNT